MKHYTLYFLTLLFALSLASCKQSPQYIYVDNISGDEAKLSFIEGEDDNDAYFKAFESYSNARFYPQFSAFEKTRKYIAENDSSSEACEGIEGEVAPPDNSEGGDVIPSSDEVNTMGERPVYTELSKFNTPTFTLYKITGSEARDAAQDYIDKKITYEEFVKRIQDNVEEINLYEKNFDNCVAIDRKVFDKLQTKLDENLKKIDKDVANKQGDAVE